MINIMLKKLKLEWMKTYYYIYQEPIFWYKCIYQSDNQSFISVDNNPSNGLRICGLSDIAAYPTIFHLFKEDKETQLNKNFFPIKHRR